MHITHRLKIIGVGPQMIIKSISYKCKEFKKHKGGERISIGQRIINATTRRGPTSPGHWAHTNYMEENGACVQNRV